jgi:hypothetical protein
VVNEPFAPVSYGGRTLWQPVMRVSEPVRASDARALRAARPPLPRAIDEYVTAQRVSADRTESRVNLGNLYAQQQRFAAADAEFAAARA